MTGWMVERKPNGIKIFFSVDGEHHVFFLPQDECNRLAKTIWHAQREYWKERERFSRRETCPRCGSKNIHETYEVYAPEGLRAMKCSDCYYTWWEEI